MNARRVVEFLEIEDDGDGRSGLKTATKFDMRRKV